VEGEGRLGCLRCVKSNMFSFVCAAVLEIRAHGGCIA